MRPPMSEQFVSSTSSETTVGPRVFISYARSDGEQFATALRRALQRQNIPLWQDRVAMEGGRDWWLQIEEALNKVKFMVMVMTPNALTSPIVKKEWRYARQRGVCVYPVKGAPNLDFASLPRWMRDAHFYDLGYNLDALHEGPEWETFIRHLNGSCTVPRVPFMVEDLPSDFVMRAEEDEIVCALLDEQREKPVAITAALRGAGGYGKTTLAMAICHNERVQEAFDDGILWVTLGEKASENDLSSKLNDLILVLSGKRSQATELRTLTLQFAELLAERDILLVIDDVWKPEHLKPFLHGGKRCARLITTRNDHTLPPEAHKINVDALRDDEALALISAGLPNGERAALQRLAERLHNWAQLVKLANGVLRNRLEHGESLAQAIDYAERAYTKRGLSAFDPRNEADRRRAAKSTLEVSLDLLSDDERARFGELAIFPEDIEIPMATVARLWQATADLDDLDSEDLCARLRDISLLQNLNLSQRTIRLHDVVSHYLIDAHRAALTELHSKFLRAYGVAHWAELPRDEPYLWDHLAYHLLAAGRRDELRAALLDYRYLQAKLDARDVNALLSDFRAFLRGGDDKPVRMVRQALDLSVYALTKDKAALAHQLYSRLHAQAELLEIAALREQISAILRLLPLNEPTHEMLAGSRLLRILREHKDTVLGVRELKDRRLLSWSREGILRLWTADGIVLKVLKGHEESIGGALELRDGRLLSWSDDHTLRLWATDGTEITTLRGHEGRVSGALELRDGRLISWSADKTIRIWTAGGNELAVLSEHERAVSGMTELRDERLLSWSRDGTLRLWTKDGAVLKILEEHGDAVNGALELGDKRLLSWSANGTLCIWAADGTTLRFLREHKDTVYGALELRDGRLLSWSRDGTLRLWTKDGEMLRALEKHEDAVNGALELQDGQLLSWSEDGALRLWSRDGSQSMLWGKHEDAILGALALQDQRLLSWDNHRLCLWVANQNRAVLRAYGLVVADALELQNEQLVSYGGNALHLWAKDGTEVRLLGHGVAVINIYPLRSGQLLSWAENDTLCLWSADGKVSKVLSGHGAQIRGARELWDRRLLSWSDDRTLRLWAADGTALKILEGHEDTIYGVRELRDGRLLSWSADETLRLWASNGTELKVLRGHEDWVTGVRKLQGRRLLSWSWDKTLRLWTVDGTTVAVLRGHEASVKGARELRDRRLLSWSRDNTLRLWAADGTERAVLRGHENSVWGALELRDGRLLSWSADRTLRLWAADGMPIGAIRIDASPSELRAWFAAQDADWGTFIKNWKRYALAPERGLLAWHGGAALHLCRAETGEELDRFYADSHINMARFLQGGAVVALGCANGQVIFLQVNL
jgi:WD40 repeat protein